MRTATVGGCLISAVVHAGLMAAATMTGPEMGTGQTPLSADAPEMRARKGRATTLVIMVPAARPAEQRERPQPAPPQESLSEPEQPVRTPALPQGAPATVARPVERIREPAPAIAAKPIRLPDRPAEMSFAPTRPPEVPRRSPLLLEAAPPQVQPSVETVAVHLPRVEVPAERPRRDTPSRKPAAVASASSGASGATRAARMAEAPAPRYPPSCRRRGQEGEVLLDVHVLEDGRVDRVRVRKSSGYPAMDREAVRAVRKARFTPAKRDGEPIACWVVQPVAFRLR